MRRWDRSGMGVIGTYDNSGSVHNCGTSSKLLGTITKSEIDAGQINHALLYTYSSEKKVDGGAMREYPCRIYRTGNSTRTWAHNTGFIFQLDPRINVDALTIKPIAKVMLKAMQRYGMIFTDNNGAGYQNVQAESATGKPWSWGDTFNSLNWASLILDNLRLIQCHSADCPGYVPPATGSSTGTSPTSPSNLSIVQ